MYSFFDFLSRQRYQWQYIFNICQYVENLVVTGFILSVSEHSHICTKCSLFLLRGMHKYLPRPVNVCVKRFLLVSIKLLITFQLICIYCFNVVLLHHCPLLVIMNCWRLQTCITPQYSLISLFHERRIFFMLLHVNS